MASDRAFRRFTSLWTAMIVAAWLLAVVATVDRVWGQVVTERVIQLPEDGTKWHLSVVGDEGPEYQKVLHWFDSEPLYGLRLQVFFHPVTTNTAVYKERYAPNLNGLPAVRLQEGSGQVVYEAVGPAMPSSGRALYSEMSLAYAKNRLWHRRTQPEVSPEAESPQLDPPLDPLAPVGPPTMGLLTSDWFGVAVLCVVVLFMFGIVFSWARAPRS